MNTDAIAALRTTDSRNRIAQGISYLLHPALMPLYTTLVFLWGNTLFRFMPLYLKGYVTGIVILTTLLAPMAFLLLLKATGIIRDYGLKSQADRIVPLLMTSVCYIACTLLLQKIMGSTLLYAFFIGIPPSLMTAACPAVSPRTGGTPRRGVCAGSPGGSGGGRRSRRRRRECGGAWIMWRGRSRRRIACGATG